MKNRNRIITTLLLTISLILSTTMPIMAEEITEDIIEDTSIDSVDEDYNVFSSVDSVEDELNVQSFGDTTVLGDTPPTTYEKHYWRTHYKREWNEDYTSLRVVDSWDDFFIKEQSAHENDYITNPNIRQTYKDSGDFNDVMIRYTPGATDEKVLVGAIDERSDNIYIAQDGTNGYDWVYPADLDRIVSENHILMIGGCDGHGEKFEIRSKLFNLTTEELDNLTLGELKEDGSLRYYEPIPGFMIYVNSIVDNSKILTPVLTVWHNRANNSTRTIDRSYIYVTFTGKPSENVEEETEVPEWEKNGYKRGFLGSNGDYIETVSSIEYQGSAKKQKPVVKVSWNGKTFSSGKGGNLNVKYSKCTNAGTVTVTIKKVKGKANKDANNALKGKTITYIIAPVTVSDNNIQPKIKNGKVKSVKVMTGGKYKKVPKKMWSFSGKELTFSGNYKGKVSVNGI